jgi:hypothetical protein
MNHFNQIRIYVCNCDDRSFDFHKVEDKQIIEHCKKTGGIYSLEFFEEQINNEELKLNNSFIRII